MREFELIQLIRDRCAIVRNDVRLGIGDDAALLAVPADMLLALSTDTLVAGVHFAHAANGYDVGWKSLAVNLSDLAAMSATPAWASLALTLPEVDRHWLGQFIDGFATLAELHNVALVGGDTTQGPLSISVTVHGFVAPGKAPLRSGARVGDGIFVTGSLGDAAAGLRVLRCESASLSHFEQTLLSRLHRPQPRVREGLVLGGIAHASIDVSDGLLADLGHIGMASGVGALIHSTALPTSDALADYASRRDVGARDRLELQLNGGDDYELCFTAEIGAASALKAAFDACGTRLTHIGNIVAQAGVVVCDDDGKVLAIERKGWEHFTGCH